jgi:DNA polymerase (family X)
LKVLSQPLVQLIKEGKDLTKLKLPGIGKGMAEHIEEIVETSTLGALKELQKTIPATVNDLLDIEGLGPKQAKLLYDRLGIASIKQLEQAIDSGKVETLPGFGKKSVEKLRRAIQTFEKRPRRFLLRDADQLVRPLLEYLRSGGNIERLEVAGSYRRRMETVGDIDILAACENAEPVMQRFQSYPDVARVLGAGPTRGTVILGSGLQVDLRVVPVSCYGAALDYFTGSKAHSIALRTLGVEHGLRVSEYGIFRLPRDAHAAQPDKDAGERIGGAREEDLYRILKLDYVPPELREDRGEVQAAREHKLPELIRLDDIRGDLHLHSKWTDGRNSIEEMVRACKERGYQYCAITDHSQAVRVAGGLSAEKFIDQRKEIDALREKIHGIKLLASCEVDIRADGSLDLPDEILNQLDIVIAAVHSKLDTSQSEMTHRILKALAHPAVTIFAHPTGRLINEREPAAIDLDAVFKAAKGRNVAIELNAQPQRLDLNDVHLRRARDFGVKIAINTDAHSREHLQFISYGVDQARRGWLERPDVLNTMTWPQLEKWLGRRRRPAFGSAAP